MPVFLVERKTKSYSAHDSSSSSHCVSVLGVSWGYQLRAGPSEAGACGSNRDRDTEKAARDIPAVTLRHSLALPQAALAPWLEPSPSPPFQGKRRRVLRQELRAAQSCVLQPGNVFYSEAFCKPWPRFSPVTRLHSAQDEVWRTKVAWSHLPASPPCKQLRTGWSLGKVQVASGYLSSGRWLKSTQDVGKSPSAVTAPEGTRRWHHGHHRGSIFPGTPRGQSEQMSMWMLRRRQRHVGLISASSKLRSSEFSCGSRSLESVCVRGQTPWSFLCLRARQLEEGVKSERIALKWWDAASKFGLTLKAKPRKYLQTRTQTCNTQCRWELIFHVCTCKLFGLQAESQSHWEQKHLQGG